jgi:hypothetical protein
VYTLHSEEGLHKPINALDSNEDILGNTSFYSARFFMVHMPPLEEHSSFIALLYIFSSNGTPAAFAAPDTSALRR